MPIPDATRNLVLSLTDSGESLTRSARLAGCTRHTVKQVLYDAGRTSVRPVEAPSLRAGGKRDDGRKPAKRPAPLPPISFRPSRGDMPPAIQWWGQACERCGGFTCSHARG